MAPVLYNIVEPSLKGTTLSLLVNLYNHIASLQASDAAMHYALQIELETQIVQHQSTVSCLQVTIVISDRRNIYVHILWELLLTVECSVVGHVQ